MTTTTRPRTLASPYREREMLDRYEALGHDPDQVLHLGLGETWTGAPPGLRAALATAPPKADGYQLDAYGYAPLQGVLRDYIARTHRLDDVARLGVEYDVAVTDGSTRQAMHDWARYLLANHLQPSAAAAPGLGRTGGGPLAVIPSPAWDYEGVLEPLGFSMRRWQLHTRADYEPEPTAAATVLRRARRETTGPLIMVINTQHNPTGVEWSETAVRHMVRTAAEYDAALLIDDAYYALHAPGTTPTSALRILLAELSRLPAAQRPPWLAVRSLGKQHGCNGWGIGAATSDPWTLEALARLRAQHTYPGAIPLQAALATWLDTPDANAHLHQQRATLAAARTEAVTRLQHDLHYPPEAFTAGTCGPYLLARIPAWYPGSPEADAAAPCGGWRWHVLRTTGVLLGEAHMSTPGTPGWRSQDTARLYLGPGPTVIAAALERMAAADLGWTRTTGARHAH